MVTEENFKDRRHAYQIMRIKELLKENNMLKQQLQDTNSEIDRLGMVIKRQVKDEDKLRNLSQTKLWKDKSDTAVLNI